MKAGHRISLTYPCNVPEDHDIFKVESHYIKEYGCDADNGFGLNGKWEGTPREFIVPERAARAYERIATGVDERNAERADAMLAEIDLDDFLEFFDDRQRDALEIRVNGKSCSVWSEGKRILRAKQDKPGATVWIKQVQSSWRTKTVELPWNGSDSQIETALEAERKALRARDIDPKF